MTYYNYKNRRKGSMRVKSRDSQKAHLGPSYLMYIPDISLLAQFGGGLCEEQTQKMRKASQETTPLSL